MINQNRGAPGLPASVDNPVLEGPFANRLYRLRQARRWSQSDVARAIWGEKENKAGRMEAVKRDAISTYEKGEVKPTRATLDLLAEVFGVTVEELAPDVLAERAAWGGSGSSVEVTMLSLPGGMMHLKIDKIIPADLAAQVITLLSAA